MTESLGVGGGGRGNEEGGTDWLTGSRDDSATILRPGDGRDLGPKFPATSIHSPDSAL